MSNETKEDLPYNLLLPLPRAINRFENKIWASFTMRDALAASIAFAIPALLTRFIPVSVTAQTIIMIILAIPLLIIALYHLVLDQPPIEEKVKMWYSFHGYINTMTWEKSFEDGGKYAHNTTQSLFREFTITPEGFLLFKDGGGAALIAVEGNDFDIMKGSEQAALVGQYMGFLDGLVAGVNGTPIPIQCVIKSMPLNITKEIEAAEKNMNNFASDSKMHSVAENYLDYLIGLQEYAEIFERKYYIVVPYSPERESAGPASLGMAAGFSTEQIKAKNPINDFFKKKSEKSRNLIDTPIGKSFAPQNTVGVLQSRVSQVLSMLAGVNGLNARMAKQEEYVELIYYFFNPASSKLQQVLEVGLKRSIAVSSPEGASLRKEGLVPKMNEPIKEDRYFFNNSPVNTVSTEQSDGLTNQYLYPNTVQQNIDPNQINPEYPQPTNSVDIGSILSGNRVS